jgi:L-cysteine desulfidase
MKVNRKLDELLKLLPTLSKPALGCTEIGAIALSAAAASEHLTNKIVRADVIVSPYIYRNVISVGVPKLGSPGVKGIVAAGIIIADTSKKLAIISDLKASDVTKVNKMMTADMIHVSVPFNVDPVYALTTLKDNKGNVAEALIEKTHDNIAYIKVNGKIIQTSNIDNIKTNTIH